MKYAVTLEKAMRKTVHITVEGGPEVAMKHAIYNELYGIAKTDAWKSQEIFAKDVEEA